ncbi:MAG: tetratricopeptide repeat protein [Nitrococcus sp.]|nr:tetratricopeptide repeat protein [Nitrococcus sp.]
MARKLASALVVALMGTPPTITALGLGEIDSDSALNEPLSARIPLLSLERNDAASIRVSLASPAAFERAGLDRPFYLSRLKFEVKQTDGQQYILISSEKPVKEPFLDFLLDVRWPQGAFQREYTVLLSPTQYALNNSAGPVHSEQVSASQTWPRSEGYTPAQASMPVSIAAEGGVDEPAPSGATRYGPVQANQTLWSIAREVRPNGDVSVYQTLQAILLANPAAFIDGNINFMIEGSVLRVPTPEEIARLDAGKAALRMQEQLVRWERAHSIAGSETALAQASSETAAMPSGSAAETDTTSAVSPAKGRLHVVATPAGGEAQATPSLVDEPLAPTEQNILRLQQELALAEEQNASLETANTRLQHKASLLKDKVADLKGVVNRELDSDVSLPVIEANANRADGSIAAVQQGLAVDSQNEATLASSAAGSQANHSPTTESGRIRQPDLTNQAAAAKAPQSRPTQAHTDSADAQANPAVRQPADPSLKARILDYLPAGAKWVVLLATGLLLALSLLWAIRRRRSSSGPRREPQPEALAEGMEQAFAFVNPDSAATTAGHADGQPRVAAAASERTALDEAEACVARGQYEQAQELLDRALGEQPDNVELRLKLLEVLVAQGDRNGFEAEAQVLHTQLADQSDPHWHRTIELGRQIAPGNPLFSDALTSDGTTTQPPQSVDTTTVAAAESADTPPPRAMGTDFDLGVGTLSLDLLGNRGKDALQSVDGREESTVLEFNLGEIEEFASQKAELDAASSSSRDALDDEDNELGSLDFSVPEDLDVPQEQIRGDGSDSDQGDTLQLDDDSLQSEPDTEQTTADEVDDLMDLDEVGTKLDLARAYLDMGDTDGARNLLEEVVTEGNPAQQSEAQELLQKVG